MCGIAGFIGDGTTADLVRMIGTISHRGPDDQGFFHKNGVGLAHARLSIIDLTSAGHQPMWNTERTVGIVFNGEIYNFFELRKELVATGRKFLSSSDTEVIIALYEKHGDQCFKYLEGMFAIAIYDVMADKLLLSRDRMGEKPLYYSFSNGTFVFASEPKAVLAHPFIKKSINQHALEAYLALDYVPTPLSIWEGIKKLEPGNFIVFEKGRLQIKSFWNPILEQRNIHIQDASKELDSLLDSGVASRLVSDVPLGVFLSGGLDSSTVAYYAAKNSMKPIHTFSIGFNESSFDESKYAKEVSRHLGTIHHHKLLSAKDSLDSIPNIFAKLDEPMADASILPTYLLSLFTKEHVTVALGGDGGDELFAGYPTFQAENFVRMYQLLPLSLRRMFPSMVRFFPISDENFNLRFKLEKFFEGANELNIARRHMCWLGSFGDGERRLLLTYSNKSLSIIGGAYESAEKYFSAASMINEYNRMLFMYQRTYMMDEVMVKVDRASMYAALETRAPFLDRRIVEFANCLPYDMKLRRNTTKYLLKKTMQGKLPQHIIEREKKGFGIPLGSWLRSELRDWGEELLIAPPELLGGMLSKSYVRKLWDEHQKGVTDHRKKLWNLLVLLEWERKFLK